MFQFNQAKGVFARGVKNHKNDLFSFSMISTLLN